LVPHDSAIDQHAIPATPKPAGDAIVGIDTLGNIVLLDSRAEELFQFSRAELLGRPAVVLMPVRYRQSFLRRPNPWSSPKETGGIEFAGRRKNGTEFVAEVAAHSLDTLNGKVTLLTFREQITRENLQDQLKQAKKMEALGQLAGEVFHESNNLLHIILGQAELALRSRSRRFPQRSLEEILIAANAASSLASRLLSYSRKDNTDLTVVDLNETLRELEGILRTILGKHITLELSLGQDALLIKAEPSLIKRLIFNLVANARDAMPNRGRLIIETATIHLDQYSAASRSELPPGTYVSLRVADTGRGMDEQTRSNLFKPFFTTKARGTGLGLSNVYGIVKECGGAITVMSAPMRGTAFTLFFPQASGPLRAKLKSPRILTKSGGETIMVVEDKTPLRKLFCKFLKSCGYYVLEARDGVAALQRMRRYSGTINLLLTDIVMPTISGPDLARRLNQLDPNTRVLFITGGAGEVTGQRDRAEKKAIVLKKPFSLETLARAIRETLQQPRRPHNSVEQTLLSIPIHRPRAVCGGNRSDASPCKGNRRGTEGARKGTAQFS